MFTLHIPHVLYTKCWIRDPFHPWTLPKDLPNSRNLDSKDLWYHFGKEINHLSPGILKQCQKRNIFSSLKSTFYSIDPDKCHESHWNFDWEKKWMLSVKMKSFYPKQSYQTKGVNFLLSFEFCVKLRINYIFSSNF